MTNAGTETSSNAGDAPVLVQTAGPVVEVILNRPERRNALTGPLATQLADAIERLNETDGLAVLVLRGAGSAFCSGLDLKEFGREPQPDWVAGFGAEWQRVHIALFNCPFIVVGALERAAVNGGAALALACDFLIAGEQSFLQVGEIQQGMPAPMNMAWLRLRHSEAMAARVALVGDRLGGRRLVELGLATDVVADEDVVMTAKAMAARLAEHDLGGIRRIKTMLRRVGVEETAEEWFAKARAADPLEGVRMKPIAARPT